MRIHATVSVPLLACVLLAGCSSSDEAASTGDRASAGPTASAAATSASASPAATATAVPGASTSAQPGTGPASGSATPAPDGSRAPASALQGTAAGDYTYDISGTYSLGGPPSDARGTAALTVTPLQAGRQRTTLRTERSETVQDLVVRSAGTYLARLAAGTPVNKEFAPSPPVLLFPSPATIGRTWSWDARSTDRKSTVRTSNEVLRTETLTIGGKRVATVVLQSHVVISGDVSYSADVTTWVATAYRLPVKDRTVGKGTYAGIPFTTDITSVLRSVHPA